MDSLNPCGQHSQSPDKAKAEDMQKEYLQLLMIGNFCDFMTAVIPTLFIGPATDALGRYDYTYLSFAAHGCCIVGAPGCGSTMTAYWIHKKS
jgi:hypothetical protein